MLSLDRALGRKRRTSSGENEMAESSVPNISISNSRTISYEETTKRKFSFSVEDLAQSDAADPNPQPLCVKNFASCEVEDRISRNNTREPSRPSCSNKRCDSKGSDVSPAQPNKKARSLFTVDQVYALERCFQRQKYLGTEERLELSRALNMSEVQVKTWFQNRRMKLKRKQAELTERYAKMAFMNSVYKDMLPQQLGLYGNQPPLPSPSSSYLATPRVLYNDLYQADCPPPPYASAPAPWSFPPNSSRTSRPPFQFGYQPGPFDDLR